jgi:hypothetical protein
MTFYTHIYIKERAKKNEKKKKKKQKEKPIYQFGPNNMKIVLRHERYFPIKSTTIGYCN